MNTMADTPNTIVILPWQITDFHLYLIAMVCKPCNVVLVSQCHNTPHSTVGLQCHGTLCDESPTISQHS